MPNKVGAVLVIGGGIGGIQSSLDLADSGFKVYLLDKKPSIGGVMAQLDKTFPTNDCSMCILSPKMVDVARHPNIELLSYSELESIDGKEGDFKVKVKKKARYVNEKCTGCGSCAEVCPVEFPNEFDIGLGKRNAIYVPFPQAVPLRYTIQKQGLQPCRAECPASVGAPGYITLVSHGKFYDALQIIKEKLPFPSICGRVCHRPCEKKCERNKIDESVGIAHIKRFVGDLELKIPAIEVPPVVTRAESVAIIGGGPAGLTAAHDLVLNGYHVRIFESTPVLGGMMRFGIPRFRLPKEILEREIADILALGVSVQLDMNIGKDMTIDDLFANGYEAVFLAIGAQKGKSLQIEGEELEGVFQATDFLKEVNLGKIIRTPIAVVDRKTCIGCGLCAPSCNYQAIVLETDKKNTNKKFPRVLKYMCKNCGKCASICPTKAILLTGHRDISPRLGNNVVVVGGGNAALDTARTALRLGAKNVTILYRRSRQEMPAEPEWEIDETELEGVTMQYLTSVTKAIGEDGKLKAIECIKMVLGEPDESGRRRPIPIKDSGFTMEIDCIISAIGQEVDLGCMSKDVDLECTPWGTIKVDEITLETNIPGVFSGGDSVIGSGTIIEAIAAGKEAAISIDRYINEKDLREGRDIKPKIAEASFEGVKKKRKVPMKYLPIAERIDNFNEVELGYTEKEAMREANRCLVCGGCADCYECSRNCDAEAINHHMVSEEIEIDVGSVILTPGFSTFDPESKKEYGYKRYPNVITSIEFERLLNASGPTKGHIVRPSDGKEPKKIAFIQCVGSRDHKTNPYCSSVCCTYAIKEAIVAREHSPELESTIFAMDARTFGGGFEDYRDRSEREYGVKFITSSRIPRVEETDNETLLIRCVEGGKIAEKEFDMVVLSVGLEPPDDSEILAEKLGIDLNEYGFCSTTPFNPLATTKPGIFVSGAFSEPKDIPETVAQASGTAAMASGIIASERNTLITEKKYPDEIDVIGQEPRIGVFVCQCGINIGGIVDVPAVAEYAKTLPNVVFVGDNLYTCSQDTQVIIKDKIIEHSLNRVVVASCSPRTHEPLFQDTIREAGLNPFLFDMANIRDQCSWVHMKQPEEATEKSKELVKMAVAKSGLLQPLKRSNVEIISSGLIIGGGLAGMTAAIEMSKQGYKVDLIEKTNSLGGNLKRLASTLRGGDPKSLLKEIIDKVEKNKLITVHTEVELQNLEGYVGNFKSTLTNGETIEHGVVIVATGAIEYQPTEYQYGNHPNVMTQLEFEHHIAKEDIGPKSVVIIHCVGARDENNTECGRICCSKSIKSALEIKKRYPNVPVYSIFKDIRSYGFKEKFYQEAGENGVIFIKRADDQKPVVSVKGKDLVVSTKDTILDRDLVIKPDIVVLSSAVVANPENKNLAKILKVPLAKNGFFLEAHVKLRPLDFATDGIFVCGLAQGPKFIDETISQACGAVSRACTILSKDTLEAGGIVSFVDEELCGGCGTCETICPYGAITVDMSDPTNLKARTNEILCKGCGSCIPACPECAITMKHFSRNQIMAQILALAEGGVVS